MAVADGKMDLLTARFYIRNVGTEIQLKRDLQLCPFGLRDNELADRPAVHQVFSGRVNTSEPSRPLEMNGFGLGARRCLGVWLVSMIAAGCGDETDTIYSC